MQNLKQLPLIQKFAQLIKKITQLFKELPQLLQDALLVGIILVVMGFAGWVEYHYRTFPPTKDAVGQSRITLNSLSSLQEKPNPFLACKKENSQVNPAVDVDVNAVAFSPNGQTLVIGCPNGEINLWKWEDKLSNPQTAKTDSNVWSVAFSPDGKTLASGSYQGTISLWNILDNKLTSTSPVATISLRGKKSKSVWSIVFSSDGKILASGSRDGAIILWDVIDGSKTYLNKKKILQKSDPNFKPDSTNNITAVKAVAFNQSNDTLASASFDGTIKLWKVSDKSDTPKPIKTLEHDTSVTAIAFSPSKDLLSEKLAIGSWDGTITLQDTTEVLKDTTIKERHKKIMSLAFSPDGQILATGSLDGTIKLWNPSNGSKVRTLRSHPYSVNSLAFHPDGLALVSGSTDETIKIWQTQPKPLPGWRLPPLLSFR